MIVVTGQVKFGAGEVARFRAVLERNVTSSLSEEGCLHYAYGVDLFDPDLVRISEAWRDQAALDAHNARIPELMAPLAHARIEAASIKAYKAEFLTTVMGE
ncbi:MAG: putative quinol monooxygenase [Sphingosinicella sp.]|uniref:putative quinol monooxygenase n=1 Tax=Sphingosinicella sp. TaxID=1917971 RepID=UPI004037E1E3